MTAIAVDLQLPGCYEFGSLRPSVCYNWVCIVVFMYSSHYQQHLIQCVEKLPRYVSAVYLHAVSNIWFADDSCCMVARVIKRGAHVCVVVIVLFSVVLNGRCASS